MGLALIVGLGIVAFLFLYFAFNLRADEEGNDGHFLLRLFLVFFFLWTIYLVPKAAIDNKTTCEYVLQNTTNSAPDTFYSYDYQCQTTASSTELSFYRLVLYFVRVFILYFFCYIIYDWAKRSKKFQEMAARLRWSK